MNKKRKIDFTLYEDKEEIVVFRFYPRQSSCHSFGEEPPKNRNEVYKVYYSYKIFRRWKEDNSAEILFDSYCDECSAIDEVAVRIKHIVNGEKSVTVKHLGEDFTIELLDNEIYSFGDGISWIISECRKEGSYQVILWNSEDKGYRFFADKETLKKFGEYLTECCEYMLAHGDPI